MALDALISRDSSAADRPARGAHRISRFASRLDERQLALTLSLGLFVLCAWPLTLTDVPPFQDLPNHLASITVIENPERYPEFVFNGFFKTNAALFAWLHFVGRVASATMAAKLFAVLVIAANALVFPRFVLAMTGSKKRMVMASLFLAPMVHNWFICTGMLDFALGIPLALEILMALERQRRAPSIATGILVCALGVVGWYAHVFPLLVVFMLVTIDAVVRPIWKAPASVARGIALPLVPVSILVVISIIGQLRDSVGPMTGNVDFRKILPVWELAYNLWAEWFWGFSKLTVTSVVPCIALAVIGFRRRSESPPFFSSPALAALGVLYAFSPYTLTNWFHVNSRFIPFLWMAMLLRVPEALPKKLVAGLTLSTLLYSAGMGIDYVRLERDRREFTAGIDAVPEGARLLPLLFRDKATSENTRNVLHHWGFYVMAKHTSAPLLFAHSHSFPVMYGEPPPVRFNHLPLEGFASTVSDPASYCAVMLERNTVFEDCGRAFAEEWAQLWAAALPRYDHLLVWDPTPEATSTIPHEYQRIFAQGRLSIYARTRPETPSEPR